MAATRLSFSYPENMKEKLIQLAKKDGRSLSGYVQRILASHIEEKSTSIIPTKRRKTHVIKR